MSGTVEPRPAASATFYFCCSVLAFSHLNSTGRRVWLSKARELGGGFSAFEGGSWPLFGSARYFSRASAYQVFRFWAALLRVHAAAHRGQHIASHRTALPSIAQCISASHARVFNTWFFDRPEIADFGGLGGPGRPGNLSKRSGASPPTVSKGLCGPPGAAQTPKIVDVRSVKKPCIKNLGVR